MGVPVRLTTAEDIRKEVETIGLPVTLRPGNDGKMAWSYQVIDGDHLDTEIELALKDAKRFESGGVIVDRRTGRI